VKTIDAVKVSVVKEEHVYDQHVVIAHNKINAVRNPNAISAVIIVTKI